MEIKGDFILRQIAGETVLIPVNTTARDMNGMAVLNEVGARLWELLPEAEDTEALVAAILNEYEVDAETARKDVHDFMEKLKQYAMI